MLPLRLRIASLSIALLTAVACTLLPSSITPPSLPGKSKDPNAESNAKLAAEGVNAFAADLYAQLRAKNGNLVVSPYSISTALAMTASGAEGGTAEQMWSVLHLPESEKLGPAYRAMTASVTTPPRSAKHKPELSVANSLWMQKGHPWKKDFLTGARNNFKAGMFDADFVSDPESGRGRINRWVEKETRERIKDLVPLGALDRNTRMVLANAIYFKAKWAEPFKKEKTEELDFTLTAGMKVRTPIMHQRGEFWLWETENLQVLKMPYDGNSTSMYILLPRQTNGLPALEAQLTAKNLPNWISGDGKIPLVEVKVWLPKFKFTVPIELGATLQTMGMTEAFDPMRANFRGMSDHTQGLYISRVLHKAFVELDEEGTEAAAATAVVMMLRGAAQPLPSPVKEFRADHPFVFVIKHEPTGAVLFMGRVEDPAR
ncbi:MAG: serpin family protein [Planctomycetia bacterium]|nr:serpin family protein [Planctomycetia bacterium]